MKIKVKWNDEDIEKARYESMLEKIMYTFEMPRWAYLNEEWNDMVVKKVWLEKKISGYLHSTDGQQEDLIHADL